MENYNLDVKSNHLITFLDHPSLNIQNQRIKDHYLYFQIYYGIQRLIEGFFD